MVSSTSHNERYSRNPLAYQSGNKTFLFDRSIYAHISVKRSLIAAQFGKCCFCERLKSLWQILQLAAEQPKNTELQTIAEEAQEELNKATQDDAEYSAASRWAIRTKFQFVIG